MKKAIAIALLGLVWAGVVTAQTAGTNAVSRNGYCFNSTTGQMVDCVTGAALNSDVARDRDYSCAFSNIISNTLTTQTEPDSSAVLYTGDCKRWYLQVRVTGFGSGVAIPWATLGIRVRSHIAGVNDSLNTIVWDPTPVLIASGATATDSLAYGAVTKGTAAAFGGDEIKLTATHEGAAAVAVAAFNNPHNYLIPLVDSRGIWYEGLWTSVFVRVAASSANVPHVVTVSLVGKP